MTVGLTWRRTARRIKRLKEAVLSITPDYSIARPPTFWRSRRSHVFLCTLAYYLQWHLKQRLDRQWTVRNVIERLAAIAATRARWALWSSRKSPHLSPTNKRSSIIS